MDTERTFAEGSMSESQGADKDAERQERVKAKNRRAQKRYREKKLQEVDQYKLQVKELNARLRQMAEDKRTIQKDRDRLERIVKSGAASLASEGSSQDTQGRPQQKCVSIKEVLEAHPYVNAEPHDQVRRYRETADELSGLFMQGGAVEGTPEHQHILAIMSKSREVQEVLLRMFPYKAARLKSDIQRAACTQDAMQLSQPQRARLISLRATLLRDVDRIVSERRQVMSSIKEMLPHPAADSGFGSMLFKAQLSTSRLKANLEQEYQATIDFVFKALYETLTPVQHARCIVAAAPFLPDIMYICSVVYLQEHGLPIEQLDLLPDMESLRSDMSSHGWVSGAQDMHMTDPDGLWPMVYQGLGVYREPVQRPMMSLPSPSLFGTAPGPQDDLLTLPSLGSMPYTPRSSDAGGSVSSQDSGQPLPPDAIAALLAVDSLPIPDDLDPCLAAGQPYLNLDL